MNESEVSCASDINEKFVFVAVGALISYTTSWSSLCSRPVELTFPLAVVETVTVGRIEVELEKLGLVK